MTKSSWVFLVFLVVYVIYYFTVGDKGRSDIEINSDAEVAEATAQPTTDVPTVIPDEMAPTAQPIQLYYDAVYPFSEGLAEVTKDREYGFGGKRGFIDKQGNEVVAPIYDDVDSFSEGLARVEKDGKWGFIDKQGGVVIPLIYDFISDFSEGLAPVQKDGVWYLIDKTGRIQTK